MITNLVAAAVVALSPNVKWQLDDVRENNRLALIEEAEERRFNATNRVVATNSWYYIFLRRHYPQPLRVDTNYIELGFRRDGVVLWRVPPEASNNLTAVDIFKPGPVPVNLIPKVEATMTNVINWQPAPPWPIDVPPSGDTNKPKQAINP